MEVTSYENQSNKGGKLNLTPKQTNMLCFIMHIRYTDILKVVVTWMFLKMKVSWKRHIIHRFFR